MGKVLILHNKTTLDLPVDRVLDGVLESGYKKVIVIGIDEDDTLNLHSSCARLAEIHTDLCSCALKILLGEYGDYSS